MTGPESRHGAMPGRGSHRAGCPHSLPFPVNAGPGAQRLRGGPCAALTFGHEMWEPVAPSVCGLSIST